MCPAREARPADICRVDELLSAGLDAVYVCVPPFAHGAPESAVVSAGLPLFVEKPLAATAEVAERVGAEVAAAGVLTAVGHHWRYLEVVERARRLLAGPEPGSVPRRTR